MYFSHFQCTECASQYPITQPMNLCPKDNRPVKMVLDLEAINRDFPDMSWYQPEEKSMWRFGALMGVSTGAGGLQPLSLGEGHTPRINISDYGLCQSLNLNVFLKDEGQAHVGFGSNPTASFKDRGMAMVSTMARHFELNKLAVPTQGNAGDSLSEYGQHFGFDVGVIMPDDTPMAIMGKVAAYSQLNDKIQLHLVKGTIREAGALMKEKLLPAGYFNCATFQEPGWRIEGKKSMGLELAEPLSTDNNEWRLPDVIFYPTGGGTGILGMWKAFDELEALGVIGTKRPKIIAVQSEQNAPVVDAFYQGLADSVPTQGGQTLATGLNVPGGVGHKAVLDVIRRSQGCGIAVSEEEIAHHSKQLYRQFGLLISPEGAAAIAALQEANNRGLVNSEQTIVCFNTGSAEKYLPDVRQLFVPQGLALS